MNIIGFNFTRVLVEKKNPIKGKLNIDFNINIQSLQDAGVFVLDKTKRPIKLNFLFKTDYKPDIGTLELGGELVYLIDAKNGQKVLEDWKKNKKLPSDIMAEIMNHIFNKCQVQAIATTREVNLPPPMPLPKIQQAVAEAKAKEKSKKKK